MPGLGEVAQAQELARDGYVLVSQLRNAPTQAFWLALLAKVAVASGDLDAAAAHLQQVLAVWSSDTSGQGGLIDLLENLHVIPADLSEVGACFSAARDEYLRAARLFNQGAAIRQMHSVPREPYSERWQAPYLAKARAALGDAAFEAAYAARMSLASSYGSRVAGDYFTSTEIADEHA